MLSHKIRWQSFVTENIEKYENRMTKWLTIKLVQGRVFDKAIWHSIGPVCTHNYLHISWLLLHFSQHQISFIAYEQQTWADWPSDILLVEQHKSGESKHLSKTLNWWWRIWLQFVWRHCAITDMWKVTRTIRGNTSGVTIATNNPLYQLPFGG